METFVKNKYLAVKLDRMEASQCGFGRENRDTIITSLNDIDCYNCNEQIDSESYQYFVPQLNQLLCEDCFNAVIEDVVHSDDKKDVLYEQRNFNKIMRNLDYKTL